MDLQIVSLVEVDISSWMALCVIIGLNMARIKISEAMENAGLEEEEQEESGDGNRFLAGAFGTVARFLASAPAVDCGAAAEAVAADEVARRWLGSAAADPCAAKATGSVETFLIFGWAILLASMLLCVAARRAFMNLMKKAGCSSIDRYHSRLVQINSSRSTKFALAKQAMERRRGSLTEGSFRGKGGKGDHGKAVNIKGWESSRTRLQRNQSFTVEEEDAGHGVVADLHHALADHGADLTTPEQHVMSKITEERERKRAGAIQQIAPVSGGGGDLDDLELGRPSKMMSMTQFKNRVREQRVVDAMKEKDIHTENETTEKKEGIPPHNPTEATGIKSNRALEIDSVIHRRRRSSIHRSSSSSVGKSKRACVLSVDLREIYFMGRSDLFEKTVDVLLLLLAAYFALLATNFGPLSENMSTPYVYQILMTLPGLLSIIPLTLIINIAATLKAVSVLDIEVVAKLLEEHEEAQLLRYEVVRKFNKQMEIAGHRGKEGLRALFATVDTDGSGSIDSREFKTMLNEKQVFFTNKMFLHLFHVFDFNNDNCITLKELEKVCFPDEEEDNTNETREGL